MRVSPQRFLLAFAVVDLVFKVLVGLGFLEAMGAHTVDARSDLVQRILLIGSPLWVTWIISLAIMMRPFAVFDAGERAGTLTDDQLRGAAKAGGSIALRATTAWTLQWTTLFALVISTSGGFDPANLNFMLAMLTGPVPVAFGMTVWATAETRRAIDSAAAKRSLALELPRARIRSRLLMYAVTLVIAPSGYMAAMGASAALHEASMNTLVLSVAIGYLAVLFFAVIVALLVASTFTAPITALTKTIDAIARDSSATARPARRIARDEGDELGQLVETTNEMLARLEADAARRAKIEMELAIAEQIQTSILPRRWDVQGLDIAASMLPATKVGGDYYDILPRSDGGWLGIGDVSGHGLSAGLVMMMLQSVTATIVDAYPHAHARDQVIAINRILAENIRKRMKGNDFVTFTLLRYRTGGVIEYAGAHEEIVVWRAKSQTCERIATPGAWLGVTPDIAKATVDSALQLDPGDILVLYTDGVTEARDTQKVQFGMDRLCDTISASAESPVGDIVGSVVSAVHAWCGTPEDDVTVVVARQL